MFLTSKARYAVMGILDLASNSYNEPVKLQDISRRQEIELRFLEQIFAKLKKSGLVSATRGPGGGYKLNREPSNISVAEIINSIEEDIKATRCSNNGDRNRCMSSGTTVCNTHYLWAGLESTIENYFAGKTIAGLINDSIIKNYDKIYLDNNSTTVTLPEVREGMLELYEMPLNASATHHAGRIARERLEIARNRVKSLVGADSNYQVIFTSSATESNNLAIQGLENFKLYASAIEHASISNIKSSYEIGVDKNCVIKLEALEKALACDSDAKKAIVSVMLANNETGVIQPVKEVVKLSKKYGALSHTDASQCPGKIAIDIIDLDVDMMTVSAHKFGGPIGAAALIVKNTVELKSLITGGGQERRLRSGTHNIQAIHGFGIACTLEPRYRAAMHNTIDLRDYIEDNIIKACPSALFLGQKVARLPNTSAIFMPSVISETQLVHFDMQDIAVSGGSACSSGATKPSHVYTAMGYTKEAKNVIRVSFSVDSNIHHAKKFVTSWIELYTRSKNSKHYISESQDSMTASKADSYQRFHLEKHL